MRARSDTLFCASGPVFVEVFGDMFQKVLDAYGRVPTERDAAANLSGSSPFACPRRRSNYWGGKNGSFSTEYAFTYHVASHGASCAPLCDAAGLVDVARCP